MLRWLLSLLRRRDHRPRAVTLMLALPPPPMTLADAVRIGRATLIGRCTRCLNTWDPACRERCVTLPPPPPPTLAPGPGRSCPR